MHVIREITLENNYSLLYLSDRVAIIKKQFTRPGRGGRLHKIQTVYVGCNSFAESRRIHRLFFPGISPFATALRTPKRVLDWQLELKLSGDFSEEFLDDLIDRLSLSSV